MAKVDAWQNIDNSRIQLVREKAEESSRTVLTMPESEVLVAKTLGGVLPVEYRCMEATDCDIPA